MGRMNLTGKPARMYFSFINSSSCLTQKQALKTNYLKLHIDKSSNSPLCRMCGAKGETVQHITCECAKLAQKKYKRRHDNVAKKTPMEPMHKEWLQMWK